MVQYEFPKTNYYASLKISLRKGYFWLLAYQAKNIISISFLTVIFLTANCVPMGGLLKSTIFLFSQGALVYTSWNDFKLLPQHQN